MKEVEAEILINQAHIMAALSVLVAATSEIPAVPREGISGNLTEAAHRTMELVKLLAGV